MTIAFGSTAIVKSLRSMGGHRAWLLRELGEL